MKIELTTFKNSIAKKIFILFILSALLPVSIFAFFATRQIDRVTAENIQIELQKDAKAYTYLLSDRISSRSDAMIQMSSAIEKNLTLANWQLLDTHKKWFNTLFFSTSNEKKTYWGTAPQIKPLSKEQLNFLKKNKTLILINSKNNDKSSEVVMIRKVLLPSTENSFLIAVLNSVELLGEEDSFDFRKAFCVVNNEKVTLFCSESDISTQLTNMISNKSFTSRGKFSWSNNNQSYFSGYNTFFLEYHYFQKDWLIVFAQPKAESIFFKKDFNTIFYSIIAFTLIFIVYISFLKIREQMRPLDKLMEGIARISKNNFNEPVQVHEKDEFGHLAIAFNEMSERLSNQFNVLTALAEIDQLILSRLKMTDIIQLVLLRANDIINSDQVTITILATEKKCDAIMYSANSNDTEKVTEQNYSIREDILSEINLNQFFQFNLNTPNFHEYVQPLIDMGFQYFVLVPIRNQGDNLAFITFSYHQSPTLSELDKTWGTEFADRIAVAFANASWEEQLYYQAHFDTLTGLPNRLMLNEKLQDAIIQGERDGSTPVVLFIDLDGFKFINDSLGHLAGDNLLKQVAVRVKDCLRRTDIVARLGGDEFVIVLSGYIDSSDFYLLKTVKKILSVICEPLFLNNNSLRVTGSIGIAIYPQDGNNTETLLKNADTAMYEAKKHGRARYHFYSKELNNKLLKKLLMEADLHDALEKKELQLYYQAKIDTNTHRIVGAEALMRWIYPGKGIISPNVFIPLIEQSGLIIPIGNWLIEEACRQNKTWQNKGLSKIPISINLSAKQFKNKSLLTEISQALTSSGLDAQYIEVEITESTAMDNFEESIKIVRNIQKLGIKISIDDYGTGYSSLEYIRDFPVDYLKIDRAFIINLATSYKEQAIVKSTIVMAHELGMKVIAEGVEDDQQRATLLEMNCDEIQGFFFSKPVPAEQFEKLLKKHVIEPK